MKAAKVVARRQLGDGRRLVQVVCPQCDGRHWLPAVGTGACPRKPGAFTIGGIK